MRGSHRYRVTDSGWRTVLFCSRLYNRVLRPGLSDLLSESAGKGSVLRREFDRLDKAIDGMVEPKGLVA